VIIVAYGCVYQENVLDEKGFFFLERVNGEDTGKNQTWLI